MEDTTGMERLQSRLSRFGDPRRTWKWRAAQPDYVDALGVTGDDVPDLLAVARQWAQPFDWPDDENDVSGYAPIHAWRCLAHLRAVEAIPVLLEMMDPLSKGDDDWYLEEFPYAFAWIGPAAMGPLREYLADEEHRLYARVCAAHALKELAARHEQLRRDAVESLSEALSRFQDNDHTLNALLVSYLLDLEAVEAAEMIERAHAADRVDLTICGDWNHVRDGLGVEGLGLVPPELAACRSTPSPSFGTIANWVNSGFSEPAPAKAQSADRPSDPSPPLQASPKVGRNDPCPCGSGRKYKKCCGK